MKEQILFYLVADRCRQDQSAYFGGTEREHGFIQAPGGDHASGENVGIEK
jgi:hypothetical protein